MTVRLEIDKNCKSSASLVPNHVKDEVKYANNAADSTQSVYQKQMKACAKDAKFQPVVVTFSIDDGSRFIRQENQPPKKGQKQMVYEMGEKGQLKPTTKKKFDKKTAEIKKSSKKLQSSQKSAAHSEKPATKSHKPGAKSHKLAAQSQKAAAAHDPSPSSSSKSAKPQDPAFVPVEVDLSAHLQTFQGILADAYFSEKIELYN